MAYGINAPQGLARVGTKMSTTANQQLVYFKFDPSTTYSMRDGDPLKSDGNGGVARWNNSKWNSGHAATNLKVDAQPIVGVMRGVQYYDVEGILRNATNWLAGTPIKANTQPKVLVDNSPDTIYSIQVSISNAQLNYFSAAHIGVTPAVTGPDDEPTLNPVLGAVESDIGLYGDIAFGGDTFNATFDNPAPTPPTTDYGVRYFYPTNYSQFISNQVVADNPTDLIDNPQNDPDVPSNKNVLGPNDPSPYYLDYSTLASAPVGQAVPNQLGCVRIEGLDPRIGNRFCAGASTSTVVAGHPTFYNTSVASNSFNNVLVSLNITPDPAGTNALPIFTASGQISDFASRQLIGTPMAVDTEGMTPTDPAVLPAPLIGPITNGTLLIHNFYLEYESTTGLPNNDAGGLFLYMVNLPNITTTPTIVNSTEVEWVQLMGGSGESPTPTLTQGDMQLVSSHVYQMGIPVTPYQPNVQALTSGLVQALVPPYNTVGIGWTADADEDYPSYPNFLAGMSGVVRWKISYSVLPV